MKKSVTVALAIACVLALVLGICFAQARSNVTKLTEELKTLNETIAVKENEIESLTTESEDKGSAIESLTADVAGKDEEIETLTASVADKDSQIESLTADVAGKDEEIETLTASVADKDSQIESLTADVAGKDEEIETLTASVADRDSQIESLTADVAGKDEEIETLTASVADRDSQIESLTADVAGKDEEIETLTASVADRDSQIESLTADVAGKAEEIDSLASQIQQKDTEIEGLSADIARYLENDETGPDVPKNVPGNYDTTRFFIKALKDRDIRYNYYGLDENDNDRITSRWTIAGRTVELVIIIPPEEDVINIYSWNLIDYDRADRSAVLETCNQANYDWKFTCFYVDDSDNSVTVNAHMPLAEAQDAETAGFDLFDRFISILEETVPNFIPFAVN